MSRRPIVRLTACVVLAGLFAACSNDDDTPTPDTEAPSTTVGDTTPESGFEGTFPLGFVTPGPGLLSELVRGQQLGIDLALADINDAGGVDGAELTVATAEEGPDGDPTPAIDQLLGDGAVALVGPLSSSAALAARPALDAAGGLACSASATAPQVTQAPLDQPDAVSSVVRTALPDQFFVSRVSDLLVARAGDPATASVAIVARTDDYGRSVAGALSAALIGRGIKVTVIDYNPFAVIFSSQVAAVKALDPNLVVMVSYEESVRLLGELVGGGVAPDTIVGFDGAARPNLATSASASDPTAVDGVTVYATTGNLAFLERAAATEGATDLSFSAQAYDCVVTLALASIASGSADPVDLRAEIPAITADGVKCTSYADCVDLLSAGEDIDYDGPSGALSINDQGDPGAGRITTLTVAEGALSVTATDDVDIRQAERDQLLFGAANLITRLQLALRALGFYDGPIDGVWSDELSASLAAFQISVGLPPTGVLDSATYDALVKQLGGAAGLLSASVADIQIALRDLGFYNGPIDGQWNAETVAAVKALQAELGVPQTGIIDLATIIAIYERGLTTGSTTTTTAPATTVPATTVPPTVPPTTPPTAPPTVPTTPPAPTTTVPVPPAPTQTLGEVLQAQFPELFAVIVASGLTGGLDPYLSYTVFAPVDDAIPDDPADLPTDPREVAWLLAGHIVQNPSGRPLTSDQLVDGQQLETLAGWFLTVRIATDGTVTLEGEDGTVVATIGGPLDLLALTGPGGPGVSVVHGIDKVIPLQGPIPTPI
jgi:branched-chain amino acid transport system substrate-binding protein